MIMPAEVEDHLRSRTFAIIQAYLRGDLEGIAALVGVTMWSCCGGWSRSWSGRCCGWSALRNSAGKWISGLTSMLRG